MVVDAVGHKNVSLHIRGRECICSAIAKINSPNDRLLTKIAKCFPIFIIYLALAEKGAL